MEIIVHILHHGRPLCRFMRHPPGEWPKGHRWVGRDEAHDATCKKCRDNLAAIVKMEGEKPR